MDNPLDLDPMRLRRASAPIPRPPAAVASGTTDLGRQLAQHRDYLVRFARQRLHDPALVEDLVQEALLAALEGADRYAGRASVRTWLTAILLRRLADHLRRRRHDAPSIRHDDERAGAEDDVADATRDDAVDDRDPQRLLEGRQFVEALRQGLLALPPLAARVFTLRELNGLSNEQAARELGIDGDRCAVLLHRARARLRRWLEQRFAACSPAAIATA